VPADEEVPVFRPRERPAAARPEAAPPVPTTNGRVRASPVARKLAQERGIDLSGIAGTGPDGRIVRRDVEAALERPAAAPAPEAPTPVAAVPPTPHPAGMSRMRQAIARRMSQSKREAPHYYVTIDVDMAQAEATRHQLNDHFKRQHHVAVNDVVMKATAMALAEHPEFNALFLDGEVRPQTAINLCLAIAVDEGLIAPAVLDCQQKSLVEIADATRDLAERAKAGHLRPEELSAGTFTITSLVLYDVSALIGIIQPPQTALIGVGSVRNVPVVRDDGIEPGQMLTLALSADHRVTDGVQGALFLRAIRRLLERPAALLV
jgi:pyruvate dehydrogenase E2 component (dihydrolipoamide acetyltransferase)